MASSPPGWVTPEDLDGILDTTGVNSCCIYMFTDYWLNAGQEDWPTGSALKCVRGHVNVVRKENGAWGAIEHKYSSDDYVGPVTVVATHPSYISDT